MNRNLPLLAWVVALLLGLSALFNGFFVFQQLMIYKDLQNLHSQLANSSQMQSVAQGLLTDLAAYSQRQPSILQLLRKYGVNVQPPPPAPAR
ncbi:MAG: hypothetical protein IT578_12415 [Verrucomicrobiae bacterium]|nr:hypothetical protein [Verrucomicrobiae bacterium]